MLRDQRKNYLKNFKDFEETIHERDFQKEKDTYLAAKEVE